MRQPTQPPSSAKTEPAAGPRSCSPSSRGLQQQRRQGGAERQRVERRDDRRDGDRQGELAEELAGDAGDERARHEHGVSTRPIAMTGPETSSIALIVASRGASPCSM